MYLKQETWIQVLVQARKYFSLNPIKNNNVNDNVDDYDNIIGNNNDNNYNKNDNVAAAKLFYACVKHILYKACHQLHIF